MDIALRELWQTDFLHVLFYFRRFLFYIEWAAVLGGLIQWLLLKKAKYTRFFKRALPALRKADSD